MTGPTSVRQGIHLVAGKTVLVLVLGLSAQDDTRGEEGDHVDVLEEDADAEVDAEDLQGAILRRGAEYDDEEVGCSRHGQRHAGVGEHETRSLLQRQVDVGATPRRQHHEHTVHAHPCKHEHAVQAHLCKHEHAVQAHPCKHEHAVHAHPCKSKEKPTRMIDA